MIGRLFGPGVDQVTPEAAQARRGAALVLDVREEQEFRSGHVPGALHIPLGALGSRLGELARDREVIVVCRSGNRSQAAARLLARRGYEVRNLEGGMIAWTRARLPIRTGSGGRR